MRTLARLPTVSPAPRAVRTMRKRQISIVISLWACSLASFHKPLWYAPSNLLRRASMSHSTYGREVALCAKWRETANSLEQQFRTLEANVFRACANELETTIQESQDEQRLKKRVV